MSARTMTPRHACSWGCPATFAEVHHAAEHNAAPHFRCPACARWYRCLAVHRAAAKRRCHQGGAATRRTAARCVRVQS